MVRSMARIHVIALTQFVFLALGTLAINILIKAEGYPNGDLSTYPALAVFLSNNGVWLLLIPVGWICLALGADSLSNKTLSEKVMIPLGVLLAVGIFITYAAEVILRF